MAWRRRIRRERGCTDCKTDGAVFGKSIEGTPFASGPVDAIMTAVLGEYATGVGEAKLLYEGVTYIGAASGCGSGIVHLGGER